MSFWVGRGAELTIESGCRISNTTMVALNDIRVLEGTYIGGGCDIYDTDFHQLHPEDRASNAGEVQTRPIRIGPRAFVGGHVKVLKGVTIGEGAVVGGGSLVTKDIPPGQIWAGVPAKYVRDVPDPFKHQSKADGADSA
jgi:acetyltransferase-like isoleucine patch superfamily enzyme